MMTPLPMRFSLMLGLSLSLMLGFACNLSAFSAPAHPPQHAAHTKPLTKATPKPPATKQAVSAEAPQKLSPAHVPENPKVSPQTAAVAKAASGPKPKLAEEDVPLSEAVKSPLGQNEAVGRIYSVFLAGLVVLVLALLIARRLGLLPAAASYGAASNPSSTWSRMMSTGPQELPAPLTPDNPDYFKPSISHRQKLGGGRELVTLQLAGQWLLLGVTPTQIQFLANLTPQASTQSLAPTIDDPQLESLFNKYVEPIEAEVRHQASLKQALSNGRTHARHVDVGTNGRESSGSAHRQDVSQDLDLDEFELPDFEDVFDPSRPLIPESVRLNGHPKSVGWPTPPVAVPTPFQGVNGATGPSQDPYAAMGSSTQTTLQQMAESPGPLPNHPSQAPPDYLV